MDQHLRELYQEIILDHSRHPRHFGALAEANHVAEGFNPLCGDKVKIYLKVDTNERIADVAFEGKGCAISVASASLMTEMLKGRTVDEVEQLMGGFLHLVKGEDAGTLDAEDRERLETRLGMHLQGQTEHFEHEHRMLHQNGTYRWVLREWLRARQTRRSETWWFSQASFTALRRFAGLRSFPGPSLSGCGYPGRCRPPPA
jgi:nitrogen fixation NifU-like protein